MIAASPPMRSNSDCPMVRPARSDRAGSDPALRVYTIPVRLGARRAGGVRAADATAQAPSPCLSRSRARAAVGVGRNPAMARGRAARRARVIRCGLVAEGGRGGERGLSQRESQAAHRARARAVGAQAKAPAARTL